jgi:TolB protein
MAFTADRDGNREIYVIDADGSNSTRLTAELWADYAPAWSPDGRIAFASDRNGRAAGIMDVYVMNADGSNPARLTTSGGGEPAWSRDGRLAYAAANCDDFACQPSIVVRSVSGADATVVFGPGNRPSWSPDGRKIAYDALTCDFYFYQCVPGGVRVGRLDSTDVIPLAAAMQPAWRP